MSRPPETAGRSGNVGVSHGAWGEDVAAEFLRRCGYVIVERNARPVTADARLEIDIVAYDRQLDTMAFVEVKQHRAHTPWERRLRSVDRRKKALLLRSCNAWRWRNGWRGNVRLDVIEVYGEPDRERAEVDHVIDVPLFVRGERAVRWQAADD